MTEIINKLLSKIQSFREGADYTISHNSQGTNYMISSRELARNLRQILTPEPYLSIEGKIVKTEGNFNDRNYYFYQGDASFMSDRLVVGNTYGANPNLLSNSSSIVSPRIREITDTEVRRFEAEGVKTVSGGSFSPFSSTNKTNDYYRNENRETKQRDFENRQRELKAQEEKLAAERKKLEAEVKAETQQNQPQNFQPDRDNQRSDSIPPASSF